MIQKKLTGVSTQGEVVMTVMKAWLNSKSKSKSSPMRIKHKKRIGKTILIKTKKMQKTMIQTWSSLLTEVYKILVKKLQKKMRLLEIQHGKNIKKKERKKKKKEK